MSENFILASDNVRTNAINHINSLDISKKKWAIEIKQHRSSRSNAQNRLYWSWVKLIAKEAGYSKDEMHEIFKATFLGVYNLTFAGRSVPVAKSTSKLDVNQFTEYLKKIEEASEFFNVILPRPDDYRYAMYGEKK